MSTMPPLGEHQTEACCRECASLLGPGAGLIGALSPVCAVLRRRRPRYQSPYRCIHLSKALAPRASVVFERLRVRQRTAAALLLVSPLRHSCYDAELALAVASCRYIKKSILAPLGHTPILAPISNSLQ